MIKLHKNTFIFIFSIIIFALFILVLYQAMPSTFIQTKYDVSVSSMTSLIRIVHLSDIHNKEYGEGNVELMEAVKEASPNLIFITGDSVSRDDQDITPAVHLVEQLVSIAPVYFSYGNHERMNEERYGVDIGEQFAAAGAVVLDYEYEDREICGQEIRIGGIYGYCLPEGYLATMEARKEECDFLNEFQDTDRMTLLLTHLPYAWLELDGLNYKC